MIFWNYDEKPVSEDYEYDCNTYYLVTDNVHKPFTAMYIENEWWYNYVAKVAVDVVGWTELY